MPDPFVACSCTIRFICDVSGVLPLADEKLAFEKLRNTQRREEESGFSPQVMGISLELSAQPTQRAVEGTDLIHAGY